MIVKPLLKLLDGLKTSSRSFKSVEIKKFFVLKNVNKVLKIVNKDDL